MRGGGAHAYIHVIYRKQSLSKEIRRAEPEYMKMHTPLPPIIASSYGSENMAYPNNETRNRIRS